MKGLGDVAGSIFSRQKAPRSSRVGFVKELVKLPSLNGKVGNLLARFCSWVRMKGPRCWRGSGVSVPRLGGRFVDDHLSEAVRVRLDGLLDCGSSVFWFFLFLYLRGEGRYLNA